MFSFEAAAADSASVTAVVTDREVFTYGDLARRARRVMSDLERRGVASGRPVGLVPTLRPETLVAIYALLEIGAPIVLLHPRLTAAEREVLVARVSVSIVLDETWNDEGLPDAAAAPPRVHDPEAAMAIVFTSGSSGAPKGAVLSRRAFAAAATASAANLGWREDDRWLLAMPIAHVGGLSVIVRCLVARVPIVLSPWTGSVEAMLAATLRHRATLLSIVPTTLARILDEGPPRPFGEPMRAVFVGGDAARPTLVEAAFARGVPILTTYGLTEACSQVATQRYGSPPSFDGAVGPPLPGVDVRIVAGEIQVRGANMFSGYYPVGETPSPFVDAPPGERGWFATGDLGELDAEGRLSIRGRRSDSIITGGENVDPSEVERALSTCPGVGDVCVFGIADDKWGQIVATAIVPKDVASPPSWNAVAEHVRGALAAHKRPRLVTFCTAMVLNATGKVDRRATRDLVSASLVPLPR